MPRVQVLRCVPSQLIIIQIPVDLACVLSWGKSEYALDQLSTSTHIPRLARKLPRDLR